MISVIIPAYNASKTIESCLNSVLAQECQDMEVLVIDDGSTDDTKDIVQRISLIDKRIRLFSQDNKGVSTARNLGLKEMTGDYFTFVDSDDLVLNKIYETCIHYLDQNPTIGVITFSHVAHFTVDKEIDCLLSKEILPSAVVANTISYDDIHYGGGFIWNRIIRTSFYRNSGSHLFDDRLYLYEDKKWLLELLANDTTILFTEKIGYKYYVPQKPIDAYRFVQNILGLKAILNLNHISSESREKCKLVFAKKFCEGLSFAVNKQDNDLVYKLNTILNNEPKEIQELIAILFKNHLN